jgi:ABC-type Mn2+/Zn2+ transport system permease subunit
MIHAMLQQFYRDLLAMPILMHAFLAAVFIGVVCATLSVFVVLKRLAFIGEGIAHSALGGIALGVILFVSGPMVEQGIGTRLGMDVTTAIFCVIVAWLIGWTSRQKIISEDTSIGIFFVASMALGILLISLRRAYTADLFSFLFGSVLAVTTPDIFVTGTLAAAAVVATVVFYRPMFLFCLGEELAGVSGVPVGLIHYALLTVLAVTIVLSIKIVGVLLIAAFLVIPGATARMLTYRYRSMFIIANVMALAGVVAGLFLSDVIEDVPSGPSIVLCQFTLFLLALLWARLRDRFLPGRQFTAPGTLLVVLVFLILLTGVSSAAFRPPQASPAAGAVPETTLSDADWHFFIRSLRDKSYAPLNARIDRDPEFVELLAKRIRRTNLRDKDKQVLLDAVNAADWQTVPAKIIEHLK